MLLVFCEEFVVVYVSWIHTKSTSGFTEAYTSLQQVRSLT
jgi:hypothetical protein